MFWYPLTALIPYETNPIYPEIRGWSELALPAAGGIALLGIYVLAARKLGMPLAEDRLSAVDHRRFFRSGARHASIYDVPLLRSLQLSGFRRGVAGRCGSGRAFDAPAARGASGMSKAFWRLRSWFSGC